MMRDPRQAMTFMFNCGNYSQKHLRDAATAESKRALSTSKSFTRVPVPFCNERSLRKKLTCALYWHQDFIRAMLETARSRPVYAPLVRSHLRGVRYGISRQVQHYLEKLGELSSKPSSNLPVSQQISIDGLFRWSQTYSKTWMLGFEVVEEEFSDILDPAMCGAGTASCPSHEEMVRLGNMQVLEASIARDTLAETAADAVRIGMSSKPVSGAVCALFLTSAIKVQEENERLNSLVAAMRSNFASHLKSRTVNLGSEMHSISDEREGSVKPCTQTQSLAPCTSTAPVVTASEIAAASLSEQGEINSEINNGTCPGQQVNEPGSKTPNDAPVSSADAPTGKPHKVKSKVASETAASEACEESTRAGPPLYTGADSLLDMDVPVDVNGAQNPPSAADPFIMSDKTHGSSPFVTPQLFHVLAPYPSAGVGSSMMSQSFMTPHTGGASSLGVESTAASTFGTGTGSVMSFTAPMPPNSQPLLPTAPTNHPLMPQFGSMQHQSSTCQLMTSPGLPIKADSLPTWNGRLATGSSWTGSVPQAGLPNLYMPDISQAWQLQSGFSAGGSGCQPLESSKVEESMHNPFLTGAAAPTSNNPFASATVSPYTKSSSFAV